MADGLAALLRGESPANLVNPEVRCRCLTTPRLTHHDDPKRSWPTAKQMLADGLVEGTSGNISGRLPDGLVCLTPSSVPYDTMTLDDLVVVDLDGTVVQGERSPTTEKDLHLGVLPALPGARLR